MIDKLIETHGIKVALFRAMLQYWHLQSDLRQLRLKLRKQINNNEDTTAVIKEMSKLDVQATLIRGQVEEAIKEYDEPLSEKTLLPDNDKEA